MTARDLIRLLLLAVFFPVLAAGFLYAVAAGVFGYGRHLADEWLSA